MSEATTPRTGTAPAAKSVQRSPQEDTRSLGDLVSEMTTELSSLVRQELQLAQAELREEGRRATGLVQETANEVKTAVQEDLQIAQQELKQEADKAKKAAAALGVAAAAGFVTLLLVAWTIAWAINEVVDLAWVGFLVTAVLFGIVAAVSAASGRKRMQQVSPMPDRALEAAKQDAQAIQQRGRERAQQINPKPEQTIETVREDVNVIKERT